MSEPDELRDWLGLMFAQIWERFDGVEARLDEAVVDRASLHSDVRDGLADVSTKVEAVRVVNGTLIDEVARINQRLG